MMRMGMNLVLVDSQHNADFFSLIYLFTSNVSEFSLAFYSSIFSIPFIRRQWFL